MLGIFLSKLGKVLKDSLMQEYSQENFGLTTMAKTQLLYPKNWGNFKWQWNSHKMIILQLEQLKNSNPGEHFGASS